MQAARAVTVIPATRNIFTMESMIRTSKKKVAGYARVSTNNEEQLTSYEAQVDYYTKYIKSKDEWEFVKVYTDEGITATNTKKRDGFNQMIKDALEGKIDLIITKSVKRFARNTVDSLVTIRKLKEKGVEIYFETENIYTLDSKGEILITIMSSLAQEESRSISENVKWGKRKTFADGKVSMPYKQFLGYTKNEETKQPMVVEKEAEIIRLIYKLFLEGKTYSKIASILTDQNIATPSRREKWSKSTVESILTNEKYKGDAILQKGYTVDFLTKKRKKNNGEVPQYYVENSHPSIVSNEIFDMVQHEIQKRKSRGRHQSCEGTFSNKIVCSECGGYFGSKVWHSNTKYRRTIWQCRYKFKNSKKCKTVHFTEDKLKDLFLKAFNQVIENKNEAIENCEVVLESLMDTTSIDQKIKETENKYNDALKLLKSYIDENATSKIDQNEYREKYKSYLEKYEQEQVNLENFQNIKFEKSVKAQKVKDFISKIHEQENVVEEFDKELLFSTIDKIVVKAQGIIFVFKNGIEIILNLEENS